MNDPTMIREPLWNFAQEMEFKLRKNDHKTEWRRLPVEALLRKLEIEVEELKVALQYETVEEAQNECVDVANFAMILADRLNMKSATDSEGKNSVQATAEGLGLDNPASYAFSGEPLRSSPLSETIKKMAIDAALDGASMVKYEYKQFALPTLTLRLQGEWTSNNNHEAYMYLGSDGVMYYEDTPAVRERKLPVVPPHATILSSQEPH